MVTAQNRTNELLQALVDKPAPIAPIPVIEPVKSVNLQTEQVKRASPKLQKALDWLAAHPEHLDTPSRELDALIGVSHVTVYKAQQMMKEG